MAMNRIILTLALLISNLTVQAEEVVVIGNSKNDAKLLAPNEVQDIYMGRKRSFPNGKMALPLDHASLRPAFYEKLANRPIEQINAYWARIMFSGQASPPMILPDDEAVIKAVTENEGAIGYIMKTSLKEHLQVLLILK